MPRKDPRFNPKYQKNLQDDKKRGTDIVQETITTANIADGSITASKFAPGAISTASLEDNSVTAAKIANGQITDAKMTTGLQQRLANTFIKKQVVHRRPVYITSTTNPNYVYSYLQYGPFGYGVPAVQPGAQRRYRIYMVYNDNITRDFETDIVVIFTILGGSYTGRWGSNSQYNYGHYRFNLPRTWGDPQGAPSTFRDAYSNEYVGQPSTAHMYVEIASYYGGYGPYYDLRRTLYMEIQALDVFP